MTQSQTIQTETQKETRNAVVIGITMALILGGVAFYASVSGSVSQLGSIIPIFVAALLMIWLAATNRHILGSVILMATIAIQIIASPWIESGLGAPNAVGAMALIGIIGFATLPTRHIGRVLTV